MTDRRKGVGSKTEHNLLIIDNQDFCALLIYD
jgi:hypothetical protein